MAETAEQYRRRMFLLVDGKNAVKLQAPAAKRCLASQGAEAPCSGQMVDRGNRGASGGY